MRSLQKSGMNHRIAAPMARVQYRRGVSLFVATIQHQGRTGGRMFGVYPLKSADGGGKMARIFTKSRVKDEHSRADVR